MWETSSTMPTLQSGRATRRSTCNPARCLVLHGKAHGLQVREWQVHVLCSMAPIVSRKLVVVTPVQHLNWSSTMSHHIIHAGGGLG